MIIKIQKLVAWVIFSCCLLSAPPFATKATAAELAPSPNWNISPANFQFRMDMVIRVRYQGVPSNDAGNVLGVFVGSELRGVATPINIGGDVFFFTTIYSNTYAGETLRFRVYYAPDDQVYGSPDLFVFTNYAILGSITDPVLINIDPNLDFPPEVLPLVQDTTIQNIPFEPKYLASLLVSQDGDPVTWSVLPGSNLTAAVVNDSLFVHAASPAWTGTDSVRIIATENTLGQLQDTIYARFTVLPDYGPPVWGSVPGQTIFGGASFTPFDLDQALTFNGPCRVFDFDVAPFAGSDPSPTWLVPAPTPLAMTIVARPVFVDIPLAGSGAVLAAFVDGILAATATPAGDLPNVSYSLQLQNVGSGAISFQFYHAEKQYQYHIGSPLTFSAGSSVGSSSAPYLIQLSPISPLLSADGNVQLQINDAGWRGVFPIDFIAWDCDYPAQRRDTATASFIIQDNNNPLITSPSSVNFQEAACYDLYDTQTSDPNDSEGSGLSYAITGGADATKFSINPSTGQLSWNNFLPDFENPADANSDNQYLVTIQVTNSLMLTDQVDLTVTIIQGSNDPFNPQLTNSTGFCIVGGLTTLDASGGVTYAWSTGATTSSIVVNSAGLYFVTITDSGACSAVLSIPLSEAPTIAATGNTGVVCLGTDIVLRSTPAGGSGNYTSFNWSGPNNFLSSLQTPAPLFAGTASGGLYTVVVTDDAGCTASATVTINVTFIGAPSITASGGGSFCVGQSLDLNSSPFGGAGNYVQFRWSGPNNYTDTVQNPNPFNVLASSGGLYSVTVTDFQGCTASGSLNVLVNVLPTITAGSNSPLCIGKPVMLTSTPTGGSGGYASFSWQGPAGYTSNAEDPVSFEANLNNSGLYSVTVTDDLGCSATSTVNVSITGVPSISTSVVGSTCAGSALTLVSTPSGGSGVYTSYNWSGPNGYTSMLEDPAPIPAGIATGGIYSVTVTDNAGCSGTDSTVVTIHPLPSITAQSNSPVCENANLILSSAPSGGSGVYSLFSWTGPDNYVASAQNPVGFSTTTASSGVYQLRVTDNRGCTATATTTVTIVPKPVATATNNGPACIGTNINLSVNLTGGSGVFDSFIWTGPDNFSSNLKNPATFPAALIKSGVYRVTATDNAGCTTTASTTLAVSSNVAPTITVTSNSPVVCKNGIIDLNSTPSGGSGAYISFTWAGPNDYVSNAQNPAPFIAVLNANGSYTVKVVDSNQCPNTGSIDIGINQLSVTASNAGDCATPQITLSSSASSGTGVYTSYAWSGPDNYSSSMANPTPFARVLAKEGTYSVTVTDSQGCTATDTTYVQVSDITPPTISCPDPQILSADNDCSVPVGVWTSFATNLTDDCSVPANIGVTQSPASTTAFAGHNAVTTVTLTASDQSGNTASCTLSVMLKDQTAPTIACPADQTVSADDDCSGQIGSWTPITLSDNCTSSGGISVTQSPVATTGLNGYDDFETVTLTADDGNGNTSFCNFIVRLRDNKPPSIQCPADQTLAADANCSSNLGSWDALAVSDNCTQPEDIVVSQAPASTTLLIGREDFETVTLTGFDGNGNQTSCTFKVTLKDILSPSITCPPNITVACATLVPPIDTNTVSVIDNCSSVIRTSLGFNVANIECSNRFRITRAYRAQDVDGNSATCTHVIVVKDSIAPTFTFVPANLTVQCNAVPTAVGTCTATDNCTGVATIVYEGQVRTDGNCLDSYKLTRTWRATDVCGNSRTATQQIIVQDRSRPVLLNVPSNITVECDAVPSVGMPSAIDNCDLDVDIVYNGETRLNSVCSDSYLLTRRWTATDNCGNTRSASQRITVRDTQKPVFTSIPSNITLACYNNLPPLGIPTAEDNCDRSVSITYQGQTLKNVSCTNIVDVHRTWIATDNCGNTSIATQIIVVQDTIAPVFTSVPPNVTLECSSNIPFPGVSTATDNCAGAAQVNFIGEFRTDGNCLYNYTITRTWRAVDICGNSKTATQIITVTDTQAPLFNNPPENTTVSCLAIPTVPVLLAQDNCGPAPVIYMGQTQTPGDCSTGFVITRTWTATDLCGNVRPHTQLITVSADALHPPFSDRQAKASNDQLYLNFSLVPNPTFSAANILFGLLEDTEILITVCDLGGRVVYTKNYWASAGENVCPLELDALQGGIYLVQMQAGSQIEVEKLIVLDP